MQWIKVFRCESSEIEWKSSVSWICRNHCGINENWIEIETRQKKTFHSWEIERNPRRSLYRFTFECSKSLRLFRQLPNNIFTDNTHSTFSNQSDDSHRCHLDDNVNKIYVKIYFHSSRRLSRRLQLVHVVERNFHFSIVFRFTKSYKSHRWGRKNEKIKFSSFFSLSQENWWNSIMEILLKILYNWLDYINITTLSSHEIPHVNDIIDAKLRNIPTYQSTANRTTSEMRSIIFINIIIAVVTLLFVDGRVCRHFIVKSSPPPTQWQSFLCHHQSISNFHLPFIDYDVIFVPLCFDFVMFFWFADYHCHDNSPMLMISNRRYFLFRWNWK